MEIYLLKSTAILAIFWMLYVLFLEKENMHHFKRFYLLASIIAAFYIPLLSITEYVYVEPITDGFQFSNEAIPFNIDEALPIIETPFWTLDRILLAIYFLGVTIFSIRFFRNMFTMVKTIVANEKQKQSSITFVLLKKLVNPHTFFNFIFLNKTKFQKNEVPKEVILHEETHAKQKHSLDILFIEILQIVFWFQPFIWLYKRRIKLNHEFLADQAVIDKGVQPATYQTTLLSYSSHQDYSLSNAINYSSIKKRFTVMKTQTSQKKKWLFSLLVLPILGLLFYSFSDREIVEVEKTKTVENFKLNDNKDLAKIAEENYFFKKNFTITKENGEAIKMKFHELPEEEKRKQIYAEQIPYKTKKLNSTDFENFKNSNKYVVQVNNKYIANTQLNNYIINDFVTYTTTPISKLAKMQEQFVVNLVTESVFKSNIENAVSMYKSIYPDYEQKVKQSETNKLELAGTYDYLKTNYEDFTPAIIKKNQLFPPTELSPEIIQQSEDYYKNPIELYLDKDKNLFINGKPTTLETVKGDINKIKKFEKPRVNLNSEDRVNIKLIDKIASATGTGISVGYGAEVYDEEVLYAKINGKQINGVGTKLTIPEFVDLKITHKYYEIESFAVVLDDNRVYKQNGNTLSAALKRKVNKLKPNEVVTIFEIRNTGDIDIAPVLIEVVEQQNPPTAKEIAEYNAWAKKINSKSVKLSNDVTQLPIVDEQNLIKYAGIHNRMSRQQKQNAEKMPFPGFEYVKGTEKRISIDPPKEQQNPPTKKEIEEYNTWAQKMKAKFKKMSESEKVNGYPHMINDETFRYYNSIYDRMSKTQKDNVESLPEAVLVTEWPMPTAVIVNKTPNQQKPPTAKEIAEYNAWAKKFSNKINKAKSSKYSDYPIIKQRDLVRYKSIYSRMTEKQKKDAEAFPNIPPPPPPPVMDTIYTYKRLLNRVKSNPKNREANIIYLKKIYNEMNEKQKNQVENPSGIENLPPPPPPPPPTKVPQYKNGNKKTLKQIIEETPENVESGYEVLDNGESHYFIVYKGKKTYYNKDGFITDDKGNILPPPPPVPPAQKKANKSKGGPNADYNNGDWNEDYTIRQLILRMSKSQTKPLVFKLNNTESNVDEVEKFIKEHNDADVYFQKGTEIILEFTKKQDSKMTKEELQVIYTELYETYSEKDTKGIYYRKVD